MEETEIYTCLTCNGTELKYQHDSKAVGTYCKCEKCDKIYFIGFDGLEENLKCQNILGNTFENTVLEYQGHKIYFHPEQFNLLRLKDFKIKNPVVFNRLSRQSSEFLQYRAKICHVKKIRMN